MTAQRRLSTDTLRRAAGDVLICGLQSTELTAVESAWLKLIRPAGIILFRRNLYDPAQTRRLLAASTEAGGENTSLRIVDAEGGAVDRMRDLVAPMPSPELVGATGDPAIYARHGRLIAREARLFGFNTVFAPVLDLKTTASAKVLQGRTAAADPAGVANYASNFLRGLSELGVLGCGKHFPGLGSGQIDSHLATPRIEETFSALWNRDLIPYRELAASLPLIMASHARYPKTRSKEATASVSQFWISRVLRKQIGFRNMIVTDDMEMGGILTHSDLGGAVVAALAAGCTLVEICHNPARILMAYEALLSEAERSMAFARRLKGAAAQSRSLRGRLLRGLAPPPRISRQSIPRLRAEIGLFSSELGRRARTASNDGSQS